MMDIPEGQEWLMDMINNLLIEVLATMAEQEDLNIDSVKLKELLWQKRGKYKGRKEIDFPENWAESL